MILDSPTCRAIDRYAIQEMGFPSIVLMENAGRGCAEWLTTRVAPGTAVVIGAGPGNNGGDGFVIARQLQIRGIPSRVVLLGDPGKLTHDAKINHQLLLGCGIECCQGGDSEQWLEPVDDCPVAVAVDAMLGTGATGAPREPMASFIAVVNDASLLRVAIDVPTGVDADSGEVHVPAFRADATLTFIGIKPGFLSEESQGWVGHATTIDIGIPAGLIKKIVSDLREIET